MKTQLRTLEKLGEKLSTLDIDSLNFVFDIVEKKRDITINFNKDIKNY